MAQKNDFIIRMVLDGIAGGYAVTGERIQQLRERSEKEIWTLKLIFWVAIGLFNLIFWDPFSISMPIVLRWVIGIGAIFVAMFFPIVGIRRHRGYLYQLEDSSQGPKRRQTDDAGRKYIDLVKKQKRIFIRVEFEVLDGDSTSGA